MKNLIGLLLYTLALIWTGYMSVKLNGYELTVNNLWWAIPASYWFLIRDLIVSRKVRIVLAMALATLIVGCHEEGHYGVSAHEVTVFVEEVKFLDETVVFLTDANAYVANAYKPCPSGVLVLDIKGHEAYVNALTNEAFDKGLIKVTVEGCHRTGGLAIVEL